jgi:hypothetical protein
MDVTELQEKNNLRLVLMVVVAKENKIKQYPITSMI